MEEPSIELREKIQVGPNHENLEEICDLILNLNKGIRFVQIAVGDKTFTKIRHGVTSILTPEETARSIKESLYRWETRKNLSHKLGEPLYAMAEYAKIKRVTVPIPHNGIILVTMDSEGFHEVIIKEIIEIKDMVNWNL